jgi:hypothetical protein
MTKVCTITTTSDVLSNARTPPTLIGVEKIPTPCAKLPKTTETFSNKSAEIFRSMGDDSSTTFDSNHFCFVFVPRRTSNWRNVRFGQVAILKQISALYRKNL